MNLVSVINDCEYCAVHHAQGLLRLHPDAETIIAGIRAGKPGSPLSDAELALLDYAEALTKQPAGIKAENIVALRTHGWSDGEILEANQVAAYFAYANRTVLGLGVEPIESELGLAPSGDDWQHQR